MDDIFSVIFFFFGDTSNICVANIIPILGFTRGEQYGGHWQYHCSKEEPSNTVMNFWSVLRMTTHTFRAAIYVPACHEICFLMIGGRGWPRGFVPTLESCAGFTKQTRVKTGQVWLFAPPCPWLFACLPVFSWTWKGEEECFTAGLWSWHVFTHSGFHSKWIHGHGTLQLTNRGGGKKGGFKVFVCLHVVCLPADLKRREGMFYGQSMVIVFTSNE